jgi:NitT/TauT family transport system substrate-binding protein
MKNILVKGKAGAKYLGLVWLVCLPLLVLPLSGCKPASTQPVSIKVAIMPYVSFATFFIPQEEGFFAEQGLQVEFTKFASTEQSIPVLAQGGLDVVAGMLTASLVNAIGLNLNVRIVAGREVNSAECDGSTCLVVRKDLYDSGVVNTLSKLKGRKIALTTAASATDYGLMKILESSGLKMSDVELVKMTSTQDIIAALGSKAIDAGILGTPNNQQAQDLGYGVTISSANRVLPGFQTGFIIFGSNLLEKNPDAGKRFIAAYLKGLKQFAKGKTDRNLEIMEKYTGLTRATLTATCWNPVPTSATIKTADILAFQDWAFQSGYVDKKLTVDQLVDTRFVK